MPNEKKNKEMRIYESTKEMLKKDGNNSTELFKKMLLIKSYILDIKLDLYDLSSDDLHLRLEKAYKLLTDLIHTYLEIGE